MNPWKTGIPSNGVACGGQPLRQGAERRWAGRSQRDMRFARGSKIGLNPNMKLKRPDRKPTPAAGARPPFFGDLFQLKNLSEEAPRGRLTPGWSRDLNVSH